MTCHDSALLVAVPWFLILYFLVIYCLLFFFFPLLLLSSKMILQTRLQSPDTSVVHTGRVILLAHWLEFVKITSELPFWLPICLWSRDPSAVLCMKPQLWLNTSYCWQTLSPPWLSHFRELKDMLKKMATMVVLKTFCMGKKSSVFSYL